MRFGRSVLLVLAVFLVIFSDLPLKAENGAAPMKVLSASICKAVVDRTPVEPAEAFSADVGRLFCLTKLSSEKYPTKVTHVWYYGNSERAKITLPVRSSPWTTYSSKKILPQETGDWHVVIFGPDGQVLQTYQFKISALQQ